MNLWFTRNTTKACIKHQFAYQKYQTENLFKKITMKTIISKRRNFCRKFQFNVKQNLE